MKNKKEAKVGLNINLKKEGKGIPFPNLIEPLERLPYGHVVRVMYQHLFLTGCRMRELDKMLATKMYGNIIYWKLGKKQKSHRKKELPLSFLKELYFYRRTHRVYGNRLFGIDCVTFRRYFNRDVRPTLSKAWSEYTIVDKNNFLELEYCLQLKGLRKNHSSLRFWKEWKKYDDSNVAVEMVAKDMRHDTKHVTCMSYIENFSDLQMEKYGMLEPHEILKMAQQKSLLEFVDEEPDDEWSPMRKSEWYHAKLRKECSERSMLETFKNESAPSTEV